MSRVIGEHFKADGRPKKPFASKPEAREFALRVKQHAYYCHFCRRWHVAKNR